MNRRSWLAALTSAVGVHANSDVDTFLEGLDKAAEDGGHISLLQPDLDQRETALVVCRVQRIAKLPRRGRAEPASAPEIVELSKRPVNGVVVSRLGEERLKHLPTLVVENDDDRIASILMSV